MKSIVVCVEYDDFLAKTLPRNRRRFEWTLVVTSLADHRTRMLCRLFDVECYVTDAFYARGAAFNKGAAMEEGFDVLGRDGWICVWDADIVLPNDIAFPRDPACLYVPARRILEDPTAFNDDLAWSRLPSPTQPHEFDGYCQMFHSSAIPLPWYGTGWTHAGGCDNEFSDKFRVSSRRRAPFDVLHLGTEGPQRVGRNWRGRVTPRIDDGRVHPLAEQRIHEMDRMLEDRKRYGTSREHV